MQMNRKLAAWLAIAGALGTFAHTCVMYFAGALGLQRVNIAGILGSPILSDWIPPFLASNWLAGMAFHFALGVVFFPLTYAVLLGRNLAITNWLTGLIWGLALWAVGQFVFMPTVGMAEFFVNNPTAIVSYLLGHIAYGTIFCVTLQRYSRTIRSRSQLVTEEPVGAKAR
jgi:hypothetical protein